MNKGVKVIIIKHILIRLSKYSRFTLSNCDID